MNKLILIIYVGTKGLSIEMANKNLKTISQSLDLNDENIVHYVFPNYETRNFHVECVNPKFVSLEEYKEIENKLEKIKSNLDKLYNKLNEE